jgi:5'-nucleotidase
MTSLDRQGLETGVTRLLLTNDDGVRAAGLTCLAAALDRASTADGPIEYRVVAPLHEQSGCGQALTLFRPLRVRPVREGWFSVDGTPSDCVNLGVHSLLDRRPDLLVSGINYGVNLGDDVAHSGTVGAALEGRLLGIPAIAFSQEYRKAQPADMERAADLAARAIVSLLERGIPDRLLLNVNFPFDPPRGVRVARLGRRPYRNAVVEQDDPRGGLMYWLVGKPEPERLDDTDAAAVRDGYIAITPLSADLTDRAAIEGGDGVLLRIAGALS